MKKKYICTFYFFQFLFLFYSFLLSVVIFPPYSIYAAGAKELSKYHSHSSFSTSVSLSLNTLYQDTLSVNETTFYYISPSHTRKITIQLSSSALQYKLYTDTGKNISCTQHKNKEKLSIIPSISFSYNEGCFLRIINHSSHKQKITLQIISPKKISSPKKKISLPQKTKSNSVKNNNNSNQISKKIPQKKNTANKTSLSTASKKKLTIKKKKKQKLSTLQPQNVNLNPHFLFLRANSVQKITLSPSSKHTSLSDITITSTNPNIAYYKKGEVHTKETGIAILYITSQKKQKVSTCVVRVY